MSAVSFFKTQELHPPNQPQQKNSKRIEFPETYVTPPRCLVGLRALDMECSTHFRVAAHADSIDGRNYTAHIETWDDTTLYAGGINTLILKPANIDILSGEFSTEDDHPFNQPQLETSRRINFERPFLTPPIVVVWLNKFVTSSSTSTRIRTYASDIDARGFTIHIDTWADTTLWTAAALWVAYPEDKDHIYSGTANTMD
ncbi:hypothetical protein FS837_006368 [Tulasnella sp. UAMH 9824]|nr:hypothetical protein FS837_006368 [Tulasnella sp. UAMH 9824]